MAKYSGACLSIDGNKVLQSSEDGGLIRVQHLGAESSNSWMYSGSSCYKSMRGFVVWFIYSPKL